jgi:dihydrofolate synthase/folylpolyglutamate synthase
MSAEPLLDAAMAFLTAQTNYEQRTDWSYARLGYHLDAFGRFLATVDSPHLAQPPTIHVAGSKGKGSVCLMLEAAYRADGRRTGVFLSPHLESITQRIRIDGEPLSDDAFGRAILALQPAVERFRDADRPVTFFEIISAAAFVAFRDAGVDVVALETGLGGRLDATNVVDAEVAAITSISLEHTDKLGSTLTAIAAEKAGILKPGRTGVIGPMPDEAVREVFAARAASHDPPTALRRHGREFAHNYHGSELRLRSQALTPRLGRAWLSAPIPDRPRAADGNIAVALESALALGDAVPGLAIDPVEAARVAATCPLPGRAERFTLRDGTPLVLDAAHTVESLRALQTFLLDGPPPIVVLALNRDKLRDDVVAALGTVEAIIATSTGSAARTADPGDLAAACRRTLGPAPAIEVEAEPTAAVTRAIALAGTAIDGTPVVVAGSFYLVGAVRGLVRNLAGPAAGA